MFYNVKRISYNVDYTSYNVKRTNYDVERKKNNDSLPYIYSF